MSPLIMRSLSLSLLVLLFPGAYSEAAYRKPMKPLMCKNPKSKEGQSILQGCSTATCRKVGNKALWQQCPKVTLDKTVIENNEKLEKDYELSLKILKILGNCCPTTLNSEVNGGWSIWGSWTSCDSSSGTKKRTRQCNNPSPQNGGASCAGSSQESANCPVNGAWSPWGIWASCDSTTGTKKRTRQCNSPYPKNGGASCAGSSQDSANCPVNGGWDNWGSWASCDSSTGTKKRSRDCNNPTAKNGGAACAGSSQDSSNCRVDGEWGNWGNWASCDSSTGYKKRTRQCNNPSPKNGGASCPGRSQESATCPVMWAGQCVVDSADRRLPYLTVLGGNTPSRCVAHCSSKGYLFSGVQNKAECLCGNSAPPSSKLVPMNECNHLCTGDSSQICGGAWRMNVVAVPWDGQCVVDSADRLLPYLKDMGSTNTPSRCMAHCSSKGYLFSGVQNARECLCGNSAPPSSKVAPMNECNHACTGDSSQMCGGAWRMNVVGRTAGCGSDWTQFGSHCYKNFEEEVTWYDAQARCEKEGSNLASVHSEEENQFLITLPLFHWYAWIGGNDIHTEGTWVWIDGSAWKYTSWQQGQPITSSDNPDDCTGFWHISKGIIWDDEVNCDSQLPFICKKL